MFRHLLQALVFLALTAALAACRTDSPARRSPPPPREQTAPVPADPPALPTSLRQLCRVGVAPCDLYLSLYWRCVRRKFPESAEQEFEASFIQACERWRAATRSARGRDDLAQGCVEALRRSSVDHPNCCWKRECAGGGKRWHTTD